MFLILAGSAHRWSSDVQLSGKKRIVIKVGSALLVDRESGLKANWLNSLCDDISRLVADGAQVLLVSSGAIALGRNVLNLPNKPLKLDESQAAAAVGQIELGRAWSQALGEYDLVAGQILLTLNDTEGGAGRRSYLNARDTIARLLDLSAIPVVNENDSIATSEIRYGDNDRLAARVATMMNADLLILLSDIDGLYTAPPNDDPQAKLIPIVEDITPEIESMAGSAGSELSRGGMVTKVEAAKIATRAGTDMIITSGTRNNPIAALQSGEPATLFKALPTSGGARKKWIAGQLQTEGSIVLDDGAVTALQKGNSLLPAGVVSVNGDFARGDVVTLNTKSGVVLGQGLVGYDAEEADLIKGANSSELEQLLGYAGRPALIHRDDMALHPSHD